MYGSAKDSKEIKIYTGQPKYTPAESETVVDSNLEPGKREVREEGASGIRLTVYRKITARDDVTVTEVVSKDRYPPRKELVAVGPEPAEETSTTITPDVNPSGSDIEVYED